MKYTDSILIALHKSIVKKQSMYMWNKLINQDEQNGCELENCTSVILKFSAPGDTDVYVCH